VAPVAAGQLKVIVLSVLVIPFKGDVLLVHWGTTPWGGMRSDSFLQDTIINEIKKGDRTIAPSFFIGKKFIIKYP
jgi:hypothetical protein